MQIQNDFTQLLRYAEESGWEWGDPLGDFPFALAPPRASTYHDMFTDWRMEAEWMQGADNCHKKFFAMGYAYAIHVLQTGRIDGQNMVDLEDLTISTDWLQETGIPYPALGPDYRHLYTGLWLYFGHRIPVSQMGRRLPLTGIGRQSGFYALAHTRALVQHILRRCDGRWEEVRDNTGRVATIVETISAATPPLLSRSKIPRNGAQHDFAEVARFCSELANLFLEGQATPDNADQMAEYLQVFPAIAKAVAGVLCGGPGLGSGDGNGGNRPVLRRTNNADVVVTLPQTTSFEAEGIAEGTDVFFAVVEDGTTIANWHFRAQGAQWGFVGAAAPECCIHPRSAVEVVRVHRATIDGHRTIIRTDATPSALTNPLAVLDRNGRALSESINKLIPGQGYFFFKTHHWIDGLKLHVCQDGNPEKIVQGDFLQVVAGMTRLAVRDQHGADLQEFFCRCDNAISFSFEDINLFPHAPGKRCFRELPTIASASVTGVDKITVANDNGNVLASLNPPGDAFEFPLNLEDVWGDMPQGTYGPLDVTIRSGKRQGTRRFSLLPEDFEDDLGGRHPVQTGATVTFLSNYLCGNRHDVNLQPDQNGLESTLEFDNGWHLAIRTAIPREGAYIDCGAETAVMLAGNPSVDFDDLTAGATLVIADERGRLGSILFCNQGNTERVCVGELLRADGYLRWTFERMRRESSYRKLSQCTLMTVRTRLPGTRDHVFGGTTLTHRRAERARVAYEEDSLTASHVTTDANMTPPPFVVFVPVGEQHAEKLPAAAPDGRILPTWCKKLENVEFRMEEDNSVRHLVITDPLKRILGTAGHIGFIMGGDAGEPKRLSAGFFVNGNAPDTGLDEWTIAWRDRDIATIVRLFGEQQPEDAARIISGIRQNAKRLNGDHFLNAIFSLSSDEPSGYIFRAYDHWINMMMLEWHFGAGIDTKTRDQISFMRRFWDDELFGYDEFFSVVEATAFDVEILQRILLFQRESVQFSSWSAVGLGRLAPNTQPMTTALVHALLGDLGARTLNLTNGDGGGVLINEWSDHLSSLLHKHTGAVVQNLPGALAQCDFGKPYEEWADLYVRVGHPNAGGVVTLLGHSYLVRLGYRLHVWRRAPTLDITSNRLRDELQWLRERFPPAASYVAVWSALFFTADPNC